MKNTKQRSSGSSNSNNRFSSKNNQPDRRNRNKQRQQKAKPVSSIDPNTLINKAKPQKTLAPFVSKKSYSEIALHPALKANILEKGYERPTQIQEASLEDLIDGRDIVGVANTGTGKTGAFLIPIIEQLLNNNKSFTSLVVVPTRELALQVEEEFRSLTNGMGLFVSCFIGGTNVEQDVRKLRRKTTHLIVGTPGRLMDLSNRGSLRLKDISVLILDEFDRMLDMGFVHDIKKMVSMMEGRRQTMLFSATIDKSQKTLVSKLVNNPVEIKVSSGSTASTNVEQNIIKVGVDDNKFDLLIDLISDESFKKVIIFAETKRMVDSVSKKLNRSGIKSGLIHGNKSQNFRNRAITSFKEGETRVLVATDVAARGIDIDDVSHVINYQLPMTMDSYVHRIGRTGRAGKTGMAYTFVERA